MERNQALSHKIEVACGRLKLQDEEPLDEEGEDMEKIAAALEVPFSSHIRL